MPLETATKSYVKQDEDIPYLTKETVLKYRMMNDIDHTQELSKEALHTKESNTTDYDECMESLNDQNDKFINQTKSFGMLNHAL